MNSKTQKTEENLDFTPVFDQNGLIPCIATSATTGDVLMFAWMNAEALALTLKTGEAHYWSRSRKALWHKGATSGFTQKVTEIRTDCDQDCLWIKIEMTASPEAACHTGRQSCFYREIPLGQNTEAMQMKFKNADKIFDPKDIYKN